MVRYVRTLISLLIMDSPILVFLAITNWAVVKAPFNLLYD